MDVCSIEVVRVDVTDDAVFYHRNNKVIVTNLDFPGLRNSILFGGGYFTMRAVCFYENKMTLVLTLYYHDREKWGIMLESVCKLRVL